MEKQAQFTNKKILFDESVDFPDLPGVYKFFNSKHEIIYIGKAKNIKNRVKSYFVSTRKLTFGSEDTRCHIQNNCISLQKWPCFNAFTAYQLCNSKTIEQV